ncbi:MAG: membrane-bound lytic murein transglycosylase D [Halieaceae bacterium]|jgi:membrane-bound lytic murein transglycosylase D
MFGLVLSGCQTLSLLHRDKQDIGAVQKNSALDNLPQPESTQTGSIETDPPDNAPESGFIEPNSVPEQDLWAYVGSQLSWEDVDNAKVTQHFDWYRAHPAFLYRISEQAAPYLFHIVSAIEERELPMELALLPIVESAYDPFAYSSGSAAGMWQFIAGTGKEFGLYQNWWYDGRRDVVASTTGALRYLEQLNLKFSSDWLHALAAYNSGPGRVKRAIEFNDKQGKQLDFWSLTLPRETRNYVPKLIALARIFSTPEEYGIALASVPRTPYFRSVDTGGQIDLALVADLAGIELTDVHALNPGFNRWATAPNGDHTLQLPIVASYQFERGLTTIPQDQRVTWARYKIKAGDSLSRIAKLHGTTVKQVQHINNLRSSFIKAGDTLLIPVSPPGSVAGSKARQLADFQIQDTQLSQTRKLGYKVRRGDSLHRIAERFEVSVASIMSWNSLDKKRYLQPGQNLVLYIDVVGGG